MTGPSTNPTPRTTPDTTPTTTPGGGPFPPPDPASATPAQISGWDAAIRLHGIADMHRALADDLDRQAAALLSGDGRAVRETAQIVSDYTATVARISGNLGAVIRTAGEADRAHQNAAAPPGYPNS